MGASIFLENLVIVTIGPTFRTYPQMISSQPFSVGSVTISRIDVLMFVIAAISLAMLMFIIEKTKVGLAIRACSYNTRASNLMGVNVNRIIFVIFLLGGMLAGVAAVICDVVITMAGKVCGGKKWLIPTITMVCAFIAVRFFKVNIILVILVCGILGALQTRRGGKSA